MARHVAGAVALCLATAIAQAETLPLAENLIDLGSDRGEQLLTESDAREAFIPLSVNFVTQKNQAFCGVASIVMVLNALELPAPAAAELNSFHTFTQDNLLNADTEAILPLAVLMKLGMTLDQIGALLATQPVDVEVRHASETNLETFRNTATSYLGKRGHFVIVNYVRKAIGQEGGGHISPLAAYDGAADRFLILDVSRYKYPPVWVRSADLFRAMDTIDADNQNRTRGFVLVKRRSGAPTDPAD